MELLEADIELMVYQNYKIMYSIDFFDIIEYCFPFSDSCIANKMNDKKSNYIIQQLGRHIFFSDFGDFCIKPAVLLPPHMRELNGFLDFLNRSIEKFKHFVEKDEYFYKVLNKLEELKGRDDINNIRNDVLFKIINEEVRNIAFLLTPSFESDIRFFKELIKNINRTGKDIEGYSDIYSQLDQKNIRNLRDEIDIFRPSPIKLISNTRDAEALQFVIDLNEKIIENKKVMYFISSANHMRYFQSIRPICLRINEKDYPLVRTSMYFFVAMLVYMNYIEENNRNSSIDCNFLSYIKDELKLLKCAHERIRSAIDSSGYITSKSDKESELAINKQAEAQLDYSNALDADALLEKYISKRERIDIAFLIEKKLPIQEREIFRRFENEGTTPISVIIDAIKSKEFLDFLRGKKLELEFEKINNILKLIELTKDSNIENIKEVLEIINKCQTKEVLSLSNEFLVYLLDGKTNILNEKLIREGLSKVDNPIIAANKNDFSMIDGKNQKLAYIFEKNENKVLIYKFDYDMTKSILNIILSLPKDDLLPLSNDLANFLGFLKNKAINYLDLNLFYNREIVNLYEETIKKIKMELDMLIP